MEVPNSEGKTADIASLCVHHSSPAHTRNSQTKEGNMKWTDSVLLAHNKNTPALGMKSYRTTKHYVYNSLLICGFIILSFGQA
jgi:hypothetical protein